MMSSSRLWYRPRSNSSSLIFCPMELKFGTGVNSEAMISNSSQKNQYKYVLKEKKAIFLRKTEIFAQALLDKCCHGNTLGYC